MAKKKKMVEGEAELFEPLQAAEKRRPQQKAIVRLALRDVADADQLRMTRVFCRGGPVCPPRADTWVGPYGIYERLEILPHVRRLQVHPADHAGDERVCVRQGQEPACFVEGLARLHSDARLDASS